MIKLTPACKDYLWGGTKLKEHYGKESELEIVAETWELSTHKDGTCMIENGESFSAYIKKNGKKVLGTKSRSEDELPILIKFIDAKDKLSIQVHPDDAYAIENEGDLGKTEMWYIVECEEGSELIYGFTKDLTKEEFKKRIEENTVLEVANRVKVKKGDTFFITPGTMHAIGGGIVIAEIQESSNVTYRISDYGRLGVDGKLRPLHIEKSLEVTRLERAERAHVEYALESCGGYKAATLSKCEYFNVTLVEIEEEMALLTTEETFHSILVLEGEIRLKNQEKEIIGLKGESIFIPAGDGECRIKGKAKFILTNL